MTVGNYKPHHERLNDMIEKRNVKPEKFDTPSGDGFLNLEPVDLPKNDNTNKQENTMLTTLLSFAKRIIKPKKLLGKLLGAITSFFSIPALGSAIGLTSEVEADVLLFTAIVFVAGYFFSWSWEQMKEIITFLNSLTDKVEKKKVKQ